MKLAVLIQCHKNPEQVNMLLKMLDHPQIDCFVHVDRKSDIKPMIVRSEHVFCLEDDKRVDVRWGRASMLEATLNLIGEANGKGEYDFYLLCSGQDLPTRPTQEIFDFLNRHLENDFVQIFESANAGNGHENNFDKRNAIFFPEWMLGPGTVQRIVKRAWVELTGGYNRTFRFARRRNKTGMKFFFGSSWVCLSKRTWKWMERYLDEHPEYYRYFINCNCPDESFFQTLLMNSPYAALREDYLHYVDWSEKRSNPKILTCADEEKVILSGKLFARKFDINADAEIIERMMRRLDGE